MTDAKKSDLTGEYFTDDMFSRGDPEGQIVISVMRVRGGADGC